MWISEEYIDILMIMFFKQDVFIKTKNSKNDWTRVRRPIQQREIQSHFQGNYYVGFINNSKPTNNMVFDLDRHNSETLQNLKYRRDKIKDRFGYPSFIFTSPNKGLHMYYLFDNNYLPSDIQSRISNQIRLKAGQIELFPKNVGIRLFGGKNCQLVNFHLKPIYPNSSYCINYVIELIRGQVDKLNLLDFDKAECPKHPPQKFREEVDILIKHGLQYPNTRNNSLLKMCFYLQTYEGFSKQETAEFLKKWIHNKHNNLSNDWNKNPKAVIKHIDKMVNYYNPNKINSNCYFPTELLTVKDIYLIDFLSQQFANHSDFDFLRTKQFLTHLFAYCKRNNKNGLVEIPRQVFQKCENGSGTRYLSYLNALIETSVLSIEKNYSTKHHKCRKYRLLIDFN